MYDLNSITPAQAQDPTMPPELMASIDANARNKIAFTLDTADAASLAKDGATRGRAP